MDFILLTINLFYKLWDNLIENNDENISNNNIIMFWSSHDWYSLYVGFFVMILRRSMQFHGNVIVKLFAIIPATIDHPWRSTYNFDLWLGTCFTQPHLNINIQIICDSFCNSPYSVVGFEGNIMGFISQYISPGPRVLVLTSAGLPLLGHLWFIKNLLQLPRVTYERQPSCAFFQGDQ